MIEIRAMLAADHPGVLRINEQGQPGVARLDEAELRRLCALSHRHLVAVDGGSSLLAYLLAFDRDAAYDGEEFEHLRRRVPDHFLYIDQVAVAETSKGLGLGRALYAALADVARDSGARALCCEVNTRPPNPVSRAFHEALGFRDLGALATADGREVELLLLRID